MSPREHFVTQGRLKPCPNKTHDFKFGRLMGSLQFASEAWSFLTDRGILHTTFFSFDYVENTNGTTAYQLVIWRLMLIVALVPAKGVTI